MKILITRILSAGITGLIFLTGCKQTTVSTEKSSHPGIPVSISPVRTGQMVTYLELSTTSAYLLRAAIKAPVTGYIDKILISLGDAVEKDQLLFTIRTKEAKALMGDSLNNLKLNGVIDVRAATSGIIATMEHSEGDYVSESDQLCMIAIKGSFVFILDVPFELSGYIKLNTPCEIALPDSQVIKGIIRSRLPSMAGTSQTERYIVRLTQPKNLPENLSGKIRILKESVKEAVSLPKSSVLTDETMKNFWVMKLINDSMAVKVPVTTGISAEEFVQIIRPAFKASDLFLTSGNYGLGDTVYVKVLKTTGNGQ